jgi:hypothetical protein
VEGEEEERDSEIGNGVHHTQISHLKHQEELAIGLLILHQLLLYLLEGKVTSVYPPLSLPE